MKYILLMLIILSSASQNIFQKQYNIKCKRNNAILFSLITILSTLFFFIISSGFKFDFKMAILPYSIGFGIVYAMAVLGLYFAIYYGSFALTSLISSYSLIIPTMYGIIFMNEKLNAFGYIGIAFLFISLLLINAKGDKVKFSMLWIISIIIGFVGNGMCSTVQRMQQVKFNGQYKSELMITALFIVAVTLIIYEVIKKDDIRTTLKDCLKFGIPKGAANGVVNLLIMTVTPIIPASTLFPSISAGGVITSFVLSKLVYKEKLTLMQNVGFVFGVSAIILLNM